MDNCFYFIKELSYISQCIKSLTTIINKLLTILYYLCMNNLINGFYTLKIFAYIFYFVDLIGTQ